MPGEPLEQADPGVARGGRGHTRGPGRRGARRAGSASASPSGRTTRGRSSPIATGPAGRGRRHDRRQRGDAERVADRARASARAPRVERPRCAAETGQPPATRGDPDRGPTRTPDQPRRSDHSPRRPIAARADGRGRLRRRAFAIWASRSRGLPGASSLRSGRSASPEWRLARAWSLDRRVPTPSGAVSIREGRAGIADVRGPGRPPGRGSGSFTARSRGPSGRRGRRRPG